MDLTPDLYETYSGYGGKLSNSINDVLRNKDSYRSESKRLLKMIELLANDIETFSMKDKIIVSRRINNYYLKIWFNGVKPKKGMIIKDNGFLSTSLNLFSRISPYNSRENCIIKNHTIILIEVPITTKAIYLGAGVENLSKGFSHFYNQLDTGRELQLKSLRKTYLTYLASALSGDTKTLSSHSTDEVLQKHYIDEKVVSKAIKKLDIFG